MHLGIFSAGIENGGHWPWPSRSFGHFDSINGIKCLALLYTDLRWPMVSHKHALVETWISNYIPGCLWHWWLIKSHCIVCDYSSMPLLFVHKFRNDKWCIKGSCCKCTQITFEVNRWIANIVRFAGLPISPRHSLFYSCKAICMLQMYIYIYIYIYILQYNSCDYSFNQNDVMTWRCYPSYWPFVRGTTDHCCIPFTKGQ